MAFTSTDTKVVGHTWIPVDGQNISSVWPIPSARDVLQLCRSLAKKGDAHSVDIAVQLAPRNPDAKKDDHPGYTVIISETPALFDSDTAFEFHAHAEDKFPLRTIRRIFHDPLLTAIDPTEVEEAAPLGTVWGAGVLTPLAAVAKRRKMQIRMFRSPVRKLQVVQIGDAWLGAAIPAPPIPGEPVDEPSIDPVLELFEEEDDELTDEARAAALTLFGDHADDEGGDEE